MTCAIIDDEPLAIKLLENYVERTDNLTLSGSYPSAVAAISGLTQQPVDLLFLDIQMPEVDGLSFAHLMQNSNMQIIFTTAFSEYAVESYKVSATDYLLKPIAYPDFIAAVAKAERRLTSGNAAPPASTQRSMTDTIFVKCDYKHHRVQFADILYIEGLKDYVKLHLTGQARPILSLTAMRTLETDLPEPFMRIHRSYIVNMEQVTTVERATLQIGNITLPISESYKERVQAYLQQHSLQQR